MRPLARLFLVASLFVACRPSAPARAPQRPAPTPAPTSPSPTTPPSTTPTGPCEPPPERASDPAFDLAAWQIGREPPVLTTSQVGSSEPAPFTLAAGELDEFRAAWSAMVGPVPDLDCVPLDARDEPISLDGGFIEALGDLRLRKVSYRGAHGERIPAYLLLPPGDGPFAAVVVIHQANPTCGSLEPLGACGAWNLDFARDLAELGVATLSPDSVGYGERAVKSWDYGYEYPDAAALISRFDGATLTGIRISDVSRGIDWLETLPEIDPARIGIIGHSNGGIEALFDVVFEPRITCAVSNAGPNLVRREIDSYLGLTPGVARWAGYGYLPAMGWWNDDLAGLPVEIHQLYALAAPRSLFVSLMADDTVAPKYDRIGFAYHEAERAFDVVGGDFEGHEVESGITPECTSEWGAAYCVGSLYQACLSAGAAGCIDDFAAAGVDAACVASFGSAEYCAHDVLFTQCAETAVDPNPCVAPFVPLGADPACVEASGVVACRRDHGWYPEVEERVYPWLVECLGGSPP